MCSYGWMFTTIGQFKSCMEFSEPRRPLLWYHKVPLAQGLPWRRVRQCLISKTSSMIRKRFTKKLMWKRKFTYWIPRIISESISSWEYKKDRLHQEQTKKSTICLWIWIKESWCYYSNLIMLKGLIQFTRSVLN